MTRAVRWTLATLAALAGWWPVVVLCFVVEQQNLETLWHMVKRDPWRAIGAGIFLLAVGYGVAVWHYSEHIAVQDQRMAAKDDQLAQYQQKTEQIQFATSGLSKLSNRELAARAEQVAQGIHGALLAYNDAMRAGSAIPPAPRPLDGGPYDPWGPMMAADNRAFSALMGAYLTKYKADAIRLRDEMLTRIPPNEKQEDRRSVDSEYSNGVNSFGLEEVATDLELLARKLP